MAARNDLKDKVPVRTVEEAWEMALEYRGLMFSVLNQFVRDYHLPWYNQASLKESLESYGWEGLFNAALHWESEGTAKFTTYGYKAVKNRLYRGLNDLMRMGGNFKGSKVSRDGEQKLPWVGSLDAIDAYNNLNEDSVAETSPQPWQDQEEFEDALVSQLAAEQESARIRDILVDMPEPHKTVVEMVYYSEPEDGALPTRLGNRSLQQVADLVGVTRPEAGKLLSEGLEYIKWHLLEGRSDAEREMDELEG